MSEYLNYTQFLTEILATKAVAVAVVLLAFIGITWIVVAKFRRQIAAWFLRRWLPVSAILCAFALSGLALMWPEFERLPTTTAWLLRILGLFGTVGISVYLTHDQVKNIYKNEERGRIRELSATAASALNTILQNLETQKTNWQTICREYQVPVGVHDAFAMTIQSAQATIQNSINSIIQLSGTQTNPYGYSKFEEEINCLECRKVMTPKIHANAEARVVHRCEHCGHLQNVRRHFNGSLSAHPYKPLPRARHLPVGASRGISHASDLVRVAEGKVNCPTCKSEIHISSRAFGILRRGCFECMTNFEINVETKSVKIITAVNTILAPADLRQGGLGTQVALCSCGNEVPLKFAIIRSNIAYLNCRICGGILKDENGLLRADA